MTDSGDARPAAAPGSAAAPSAPPRPDPGSAPWHRNPFVVAFVAGVVTITWLHFRLRRVPEPPPVFGTLAAEQWQTVGGEPLDDPFSGAVTVVAFVDAASGAECGGPRLAIKLRSMFDVSDVGANVALVGLGGPGTDKTWAALEDRVSGPRPGVWVGGPVTSSTASALEASVAAAREPFDAWRRVNPRPQAPVPRTPPPTCDGPAGLDRALIVDGDGGIRGEYDVWAWEIESEILHRTEHVLDAQPR